MDDELVPGCYINCKIIGVLETSDDDGNDPKLIAVPCKKVSPGYELYRDICDISESTKRKLKYFFSHYKDLENKKVNIGDFRGKQDAIQILQESVKRHKTITASTHVNKITSYFPISDKLCENS
jgi:inorganic pyrophosphatase